MSNLLSTVSCSFPNHTTKLITLFETFKAAADALDEFGATHTERGTLTAWRRKANRAVREAVGDELPHLTRLQLVWFYVNARRQQRWPVTAGSARAGWRFAPNKMTLPVEQLPAGRVIVGGLGLIELEQYQPQKWIVDRINVANVVERFDTDGRPYATADIEYIGVNVIDLTPAEQLQYLANYA